jgi:hypothetical protein
MGHLKFTPRPHGVTDKPVPGGVPVISFCPRSHGVISIFFKNTFLKEGHSADIVKVLNFKDLAPWPDRELLSLPHCANLSRIAGTKVFTVNILH